VVGDASKRAMQELLSEIKDGSFAKRWIAENAAGRPEFSARRRAERQLLLERVGAELRKMMPFVEPVTAPEES
jgi:ketol-acid reductoisomerase